MDLERRIDAHQHFWQLQRGDYGWLGPELKPIYRDFGPDDLRPSLQRAGIEKTVLVQAAPTAAETDYLLEIAASNEIVAGVVGWIDMEAEDACDRLSRLSVDPWLRGIRPMIQDIPDPAWMLSPRLTKVFQAAASLDLVFDALVRPVHLTNLIALVERHPSLTVVVDHGAKPDIATWTLGGSAFAAWAERMTELAQSTNVFCKLSGLVTEANVNWRLSDLQPYTNHLLRTFGPERLIWGSDWPVVNLAGGYDRWWETTQWCLAGLTERERWQVLGCNAALCYGT